VPGKHLVYVLPGHAVACEQGLQFLGWCVPDVAL
jgi:hypothetical protein